MFFIPMSGSLRTFDDRTKRAYFFSAIIETESTEKNEIKKPESTKKNLFYNLKFRTI